jgi:SPP1 family predicted phage head-tail adaptor
MINAGEYRHKISIIQVVENEDDAGFKERTESIILKTYAKVKTTKGFTLIKNNTDFEQAHTNFTIRFPKKKITRDMQIKYKGKTYTIEYLNNIDEKDVELEIQAKLVVK